ncbi:phosphate transport system permease protein pstA 2 [Mycobacterium tuberculosis]|nr:phosphate transport system permease protein pstA 2 [Mycobacterium tuberculosis]
MVEFAADRTTHRLAGRYLTYPIWTFYNQPSKSAQDLSYDAALLLIVFLLLLIFIGRLINWLSRRRWDV